MEKALEESNAPEIVKSKSLDPELVPLKNKLADYGIDTKKIIETLAESMTATKLHVTKSGKEVVTHEEADHSTRLKAIDLILKVRGDFVHKKSEKKSDHYLELFEDIPDEAD